MSRHFTVVVTYIGIPWKDQGGEGEGYRWLQESL